MPDPNGPAGESDPPRDAMPAAAPHPPADSASAEEITRAPPSAAIVPRVLIVDDDPRNLFALEEILREPGIEIVQARSGQDALREVLRQDFAVILLDVQMPEMDGYEAATLIRSRERSSRTPIIFLTAVNKDDVHVFRGYTAGAVDYVFKPFDPLILRSKVSIFVQLFRKTEQIRRRAEAERFLFEENMRMRAAQLATERELRRTSEQQAMILQSLPVDLFTMAPHDFARPLFITQSGGKRESWLGFPTDRFYEPWFWHQRTHEDDRARVLDSFRTALAEGRGSAEFRFLTGSGEWRWLLCETALRTDERGEPVEIQGMTVDVTDRKELEEQLQHARKLETVGRLTGGIAHDFNNMLAIVIGNLDLLQSNFESDPKAAKRARMALDGALRCADMTRRLLAFSRKETLNARVIELSGLVSSMTDLLRRTLGETIEVTLDVAEGVWPVNLDPTGLETTIANLAVNARDAMPDGGQLAISVENKNFDGVWFGSPAPERIVGEYVAVRVADTGTGIPPDVLARVFEPFFTTKEVGRGTGLGLSTTYGYVKQSNGHIQIESEKDVGTVVTLLLPRAEGVAASLVATPAERDAPPAETLRGRGETVLVVEDDREVRKVVAATLSEFGYQVVEAESGVAALGVLENRIDVQAVFSDVTMPGMSGPQLAEAARGRRPGLRVLLTTGYAGDVELPRGAALLRKPYRRADLATRIRALLDEPEAA
ncbi:response regulator [Roseiterribacter gracilis]